MNRVHSTLGFEISSPPMEAIHVVVDEISRPVCELGHAPAPLSEIREIVSSASFSFAARRYMREMESKGRSAREIVQKMNEPTRFTRLKILGEFAVLPPGTALKATNPAQLRTCTSALLLARRGDVEGFELRGHTQERPRLLLLQNALDEAVEVVDAHDFVPAHLLPDNVRELFRRGH